MSSVGVRSATQAWECLLSLLSITLRGLFWLLIVAGESWKARILCLERKFRGKERETATPKTRIYQLSDESLQVASNLTSLIPGLMWISQVGKFLAAFYRSKKVCLAASQLVWGLTESLVWTVCGGRIHALLSRHLLLPRHLEPLLGCLFTFCFVFHVRSRNATSLGRVLLSWLPWATLNQNWSNSAGNIFRTWVAPFKAEKKSTKAEGWGILCTSLNKGVMVFKLYFWYIF